MNKPFLLIAGDNYYPDQSTGNWIAFFATFEEAKSKVTEMRHYRVITKGKDKGKEEYTYSKYTIEGQGYKDKLFERDWYDIVDLRDWTN